MGTVVGVALSAIAAGAFVGSLLVPQLMNQFTRLAPTDKVGRVVAFGRLVSWALPGLLGGIIAGAIAAATKPEVGVATMGVAYLLIVGFALVRLAKAVDGTETDVADSQRTVSEWARQADGAR